MNTAKTPFPTSPAATELPQVKTEAIASNPVVAKTVAALPAAKKDSAAKPALQKTVVAKVPAKAPVKVPATAAPKPLAKPPAKPVTKPAAKPVVKAPAKPVAKKVTAKKAVAKPLLSKTSANAKLDKSAKAEKLEKARKPKLVRDSFTIPKAEYLVLDDLKQRANKLTRPAKKSELLRAGIKALAALSDAAFLTALVQVPAIKTGRPSSGK